MEDIEGLDTYRCVRKPGYVLQFTGIKDDLYECIQYRRVRKMRSVTSQLRAKHRPLFKRPAHPLPLLYPLSHHSYEYRTIPSIR